MRQQVVPCRHPLFGATKATKSFSRKKSRIDVGPFVILQAERYGVIDVGLFEVLLAEKYNGSRS